MTELELLVDLHKDDERQGPGNEAETLRALSLIETAHNDGLKIADIGCGSGASTMVLAQNTTANITAVDLFPEFLDKLKGHAQQLGLAQRIHTVAQSMEELSFEDESFDIIWSEGAIYNMGFEKGIQQWRRFLKHGGYLAVSEISWTTHSRPKELEDFWMAAYPEIDTVSGKIKTLEENGYQPIGHFILPVACWTDHYYAPVQSRFDDFLNRHKHSETAKAIIKAEEEEIALYNAYKKYYSYGFYVARKLD